MKNLNILILGGSGFIGKNLCRALAPKCRQIRCFSLDDPFDDDFLDDVRDNIQWIQGSFDDTALITQSLEQIDIVYHLVCTTLPASSNSDLKFDLASNVLPTLSLLEAASASKVKKIIFVSSGGTVYGVPKQVPIQENNETQPICGYGIQKLAIEKYLHLYYYLYGLDYRILRLSNPYGKNQVSDRPQGVIGNFMHKALVGESLNVWGNGAAVRDYVYIDDAIDAFIDIVKYNGPYRLFNIGSGIGYSILEIIEQIEETIENKLNVRFHPARNVDLPLNILDISHARAELKWRPRTDLKTGLKYLAQYGRDRLKN